MNYRIVQPRDQHPQNYIDPERPDTEWWLVPRDGPLLIFKRCLLTGAFDRVSPDYYPSTNCDAVELFDRCDHQSVAPTTTPRIDAEKEEET